MCRHMLKVYAKLDISEDEMSAFKSPRYLPLNASRLELGRQVESFLVGAAPPPLRAKAHSSISSVATPLSSCVPTSSTTTTTTTESLG